MFSPKHPRYQETPRFGASNFKTSGNMRSTATSIPRKNMGGSTWIMARDFSQGIQLAPSFQQNFSKNPWCSRCNRNHDRICAQGRRCYTYGKKGSFEKQMSNPARQPKHEQEDGKGNDMNASSAGPANTLRCQSTLIH